MEHNNSQKSAIKIETENNDYLMTEQPVNNQKLGEYSIKDLCRACLLPNKKINPLIKDNDHDLLVNMFTSITSIKVYSDDGLPSQLCDICRLQVVNFYEFKLKCEKSDSTLKMLLKNSSFMKVEPLGTATESDKDPEVTNTKMVLSEIKEEDCVAEDAEYLESLPYSDEEKESLSVVKDIRKRQKKEYDVTITDSNTLLDEVIFEGKPSKKKKKSYMCPICSKNYLRAKSLKTHIKQYHPPSKNSHPCGKCKDSFTTEHDLQLHSALHTKSSIWKCTTCKKDFKLRSMLRRHLQRHMESKRYSCETCGKSFTELYALRRHARVHTGEIVEKKLVCHICDKRYSENSQLATHMARHTGDRPCVCATCGKTFASMRLLKSHQTVHTDYKPYECGYCNKRFRHESTRKTHQRTHTGEKPYVCSYCGKTFIQNSNLNLHLRTHTGEKPYNCEFCDRKFSSGSSLIAHRRIHTGEKPYTCPVCGKKFARVGLKHHMRLHTGERPYSCHACPKQFVTAARLREHCRIHTGEKPYECAICMQKFTTKGHLVKHLKIHKSHKKGLVIVRHIEPNLHTGVPNNYVIANTEENNESKSKRNLAVDESTRTEGIVVSVEEMPMEVSRELILENDNEIKTNILVVENSQNNIENYQNSNICLSSNGVNFFNGDPNTSEVNLVTVNEGEVSISASSAMLEGATVKLYQLDQSLVQIHSVGGQVTISKIISKMTANF